MMTQIIPKLTRARKNSDRIMAKVKRTFINLLVLTISKESRDRIRQTPKNMPTLFQEPTMVEVRSGNMPKERTFAPNIMRAKRKRAKAMEEMTMERDNEEKQRR